MRVIRVLAVISLILCLNLSAQVVTNPEKPSKAVKLVMIHASIGRAWLCNGTNYGNLGGTLGQNNYYVSDLDKDFVVSQNSTIFHNNYADHGTAPGQIYNWFLGSEVQGNGVSMSDNIMSAIYSADHAHSVDQWLTYKRDYVSNPGGENSVILFKPTHVSSSVRDENASYEWTSVVGKDATQRSYTLSNVKELYTRMVAYFKENPKKMFVLITPPPYPANSSEDNDVGHAANAREVNNWLVNDWLQELNHENKNVYVFDLYNVFTGPSNHHRVVSNSSGHTVEHTIAPNSSNFGYPGYYRDPSDPHPGDGGNEGSAGVKATEEFVPLLNVFYNRHQAWLDGTSASSKKNYEVVKTTLIQNGNNIKFAIPQSTFKKGFSLSIHTLSGKIVTSINLDKNSGEINLNKVSKSGLSAGQYILTIASDKNQKVISDKFNFIKK